MQLRCDKRDSADGWWSVMLDYSRAGALLALLAVLASGGLAADASENLLVNPGFETGTSLPDGRGRFWMEEIMLEKTKSEKAKRRAERRAAKKGL